MVSGINFYKATRNTKIYIYIYVNFQSFWWYMLSLSFCWSKKVTVLFFLIFHYLKRKEKVLLNLSENLIKMAFYQLWSPCSTLYVRYIRSYCGCKLTNLQRFFMLPWRMVQFREFATTVTQNISDLQGQPLRWKLLRMECHF